MGHKHEAESPQHFRNLLKNLRVARGFTQGELAEKTGITRQAVSSIESNLYLPTTAVALRLASVLACRVEDLFSLAESDDIVEATFIDVQPLSQRTFPLRVKVSTVGKKTVARPVADLGDLLPFTVTADGYVVEAVRGGANPKVRVRLSRDRRVIEREISVAGCDPAIFLAGDFLRRSKDQTSVVGWTMGSMAALRALQNGEVHVAGLHLFDPGTGESNLPFLRQALKGSGYEVVTFATWEEGLLVRPGNPKSIRSVADLADPSVVMVNREQGAGARLLLEQQLRASGTNSARIHGYDRVVSSHFEVARVVAGHQADAGIGIRSAAQNFGLDFVPIQSARYDLVVPKSYLKSHPTLAHLFETISSRPFRNEIEALGGYDTSETGKVQAL